MHTRCIALAVLTATSSAWADDASPVPSEAPAPVPDGKVRLMGILRSKSDGSPTAGGTIVATPTDQPSKESAVAISDENGLYTIDLEPGRYDIVVYYGDKTIEVAKSIAIVTGLDIGVTMVPEPQWSGCTFGWGESPELTAQPYFGLRAWRRLAPVSRDRSHVAWIAPAASAEARTVVTRVETGVRLHGAPAIPTIFLEEVETQTLRPSIDRASGSGGTADVALRSGSNELKADARLVFGLEHAPASDEASAGQELYLGGPLEKDTAWAAVGVVANDDGDLHGMARLNYAATPSHQGEIIGLGQRAGGARDGWLNARWVSKFDDNKLELRAIGTGEQLELAPSAVARATDGEPTASLVRRAGGGASVILRKKAHGYHNFQVHAVAGTGSLDGEHHADVSLGAGDSWQIRPNFTIDAGVRGETRWFAGDRATIATPRVSVAYDYTKEGRSDAFVAYQRVSHLDDGLPGAWRTLPSTFHDEVSAGISHLPEKHPHVMAGVAGRTLLAPDATARLAADAWLRYETDKKTRLHVAGSTYTHAAAVLAQRTLVDRRHHELSVATSGRTSDLRTEGGFAVLYHYRVEKAATVDTTLELYDAKGDDGSGRAIIGPGARLIVGGTW